MVGFLKRQVNALAAIDAALNAELGGNRLETLSGSVGRACGSAGGLAQWWGPIARAAIEALPWFGAGHCERQATREQQRRDALTAAGVEIV